MPRSCAPNPKFRINLALVAIIVRRGGDTCALYIALFKGRHRNLLRATFVVLDDADEMLNMGLRDQVRVRIQ